VGLQQNGGVQYVTTKYHNWFGSNLLKVEGTTIVVHIKFEKGKNKL